MNHQTVSENEWIKARKELLLKEKELTRLQDEISCLRRGLPWVKVGKSYIFDTPEGKQSLDQLFDGRSQLVVYHFMFAPGWSAGCVGCSFFADHIDGANIHLANHDVSFVAISRAPLVKLEAYKRRMGWRFRWVSSYGTETLIEIITYPLPRTISPKGRPITTSRFANPRLKRKRLGSACSSRMRAARYFIPIQLMRAETNGGSAHTCFST
jgi:hypothetical protein